MPVRGGDGDPSGVGSRESCEQRGEPARRPHAPEGGTPQQPRPVEADAALDDTRPTALTSSDHTTERTVSNRTPQPNPSPRRAQVNDPSSLVEGGRPPRRVASMAHPAEP